MKVNIENPSYMNRIIKIISPITYQTFKVDLNGDEQEVKELLGIILEINPKLIKALRDSYNNYYSISNALQNYLIFANPNNYFTVVLKDISQSNFNKNNHYFSNKYGKYNQQISPEKYQDKIYRELAKKLKSVINSNPHDSDKKENSKYNSSDETSFLKNNPKRHKKKR